MREVESQMQKGLIFTQGCLLSALVQTHPNPEKLKKVFLGQTNQLIENLSKKPETLEMLKIVRLHTKRLLGQFPS